jgi:hypothetical protein
MGNLIRLDNIMIFAGISVGGADMTRARAEKQNDAMTVPIIIEIETIPVPSSSMLAIKTINVMIKPKRNEATLSPRITAQSAMGAETRRSNVRVRVSHGAMTGPMEEAVTKRAIPQRLGTRNSMGKLFPKQNATKRNEGMRMPDINTGAFR